MPVERNLPKAPHKGVCRAPRLAHRRGAAAVGAVGRHRTHRPHLTPCPSRPFQLAAPDLGLLYEISVSKYSTSLASGVIPFGLGWGRVRRPEFTVGCAEKRVARAPHVQLASDREKLVKHKI